jgi:hypothetical protein
VRKIVSQQSELPLSVAVCAWCKPKHHGAELGAISHGICPRHLKKLQRELQQMQAAQQSTADSRRRGTRALHPGLNYPM